MVMGFRHPAFMGISSATISRKHIEHRSAGDRLRSIEVGLVVAGDVPVKSTVAARFSRSTVIFTEICVP